MVVATLSRAAARRRSAGRSAATGTRQAVPPARTRPRPAPTPAGPAPGQARSPRTRSCGTSSSGAFTGRWSPERICQALRAQFPDRPEMHVVHETVCQALHVQGRGEPPLRTRPRSALGTRPPPPAPPGHNPAARFSDPMVVISERPAEAEGRAVPGHWEGDLIADKDGASAIGTPVERATRCVMLLHLPDGRTAEQVRDALVSTVKTLPGHLVRSPTREQGSEMAARRPAPGSAARTRTATACYGSTSVAAELNGRPRRTLGWETPAERLHKLLAA
ncbi:IS30 family transposase [Streptomyces albidoflavus]|uniref:IS30 family transposase n=1 Tax=Streptomyces albidoflavus TaxID=1886 RepID=UPI0038D18F68